MIRRGMLVLLFMGLLGLGWWLTRPPQEPTLNAQVIAAEVELPNLGFERVRPGYVWELATDQPPHPQFQRERWHFDLSACYPDQSASITFERISLTAPALRPQRDSDWAMGSLLIANVVLPDWQTNRYSRLAAGLADATPGRLWIDTWELTWDEQGYTLTLGEGFSAQFRLEGDPSFSQHEGYYQIDYPLQGTLSAPCKVTLQQTFGEKLPAQP